MGNPGSDHFYKKKGLKIVLIGSGRVATHLGRGLKAAGNTILQVYSRNFDHAKKLADGLLASPVADWTDLDPEGDIFIVAVKDQAILEVVRALSKTVAKEKLIVHTSGGTGIREMGAHLNNYGSFYPLQTFSRDGEPNWTEIPICLNASAAENLALMKELAISISTKVYEIGDEERKVLHLAAVFANNFSNYLFLISQNILESHNLPSDILIPLMKETVEKLKFMSPVDAQTGPARRGDQNTIQTHLNLLQSNPEYKRIYEVLTQAIQNKYL